MPKRTQLRLVSQQGSIMVLVMGFSILLSMAAASLLLVAGNSGNDEDIAFNRLRCANDAESGLMIGVGWLRNSAGSAVLINTKQDLWPVGGQVLFSNVPFENGSHVTVTIVDNAPAAFPNAPKTVVSQAVRGSETVQFSWDVDTLETNIPNVVPPRLKVTNWRSP